MYTVVSLQLNPVYLRWELALTKQNYKSTATTKPNKTCCLLQKMTVAVSF